MDVKERRERKGVAQNTMRWSSKYDSMGVTDKPKWLRNPTKGKRKPKQPKKKKKKTEDGEIPTNQPIGKRIRGLERTIPFLEGLIAKETDPVKNKELKDSIQEKQTLLEGFKAQQKIQRRAHKKMCREVHYIKKYKAVKFYEKRTIIRELNKILKHKKPDNPDSEVMSPEEENLQKQLLYVNHFPLGQKYFFIRLKTPTDPRQIEKQNQIMQDILQKYPLPQNKYIYGKKNSNDEANEDLDELEGGEIDFDDEDFDASDLIGIEGEESDEEDDDDDGEVDNKEDDEGIQTTQQTSTNNKNNNKKRKFEEKVNKMEQGNEEQEQQESDEEDDDEAPKEVKTRTKKQKLK